MNQERRPISVEDLLRLKRAEKPASEFWQQFDRELRAKQLAALVAKRPWWQRLPRFASRFAPYRLPLGAAAALAVTFISVRNYSDESVGPASLVAEGQVFSSESHATSTGAVSTGERVASSPAQAASFAVESRSSSPAPVASYLNVEPLAAPPGPQLEQEAMIALELSRSIPLFGAAEIPDTTELSPSARSIAANRQVAELNEAFGSGLLTATTGSSGHSFESRVLPARATVVDPLQQMTPPGEPRRSRYVTAMISTVSEESLDRTTARMAHRISGEELYEQVQRFGTRRGGFNVKF